MERNGSKPRGYGERTARDLARSIDDLEQAIALLKAVQAGTMSQSAAAGRMGLHPLQFHGLVSDGFWRYIKIRVASVADVYEAIQAARLPEDMLVMDILRLEPVDKRGRPVMLPAYDEAAFRELAKGKLDGRSWTILSRHAGLDGPPESLASIGDAIGISHARAAQIYAKAIRKLDCPELIKLLFPEADPRPATPRETLIMRKAAADAAREYNDAKRLYEAAKALAAPSAAMREYAKAVDRAMRSPDVKPALDALAGYGQGPGGLPTVTLDMLRDDPDASTRTLNALARANIGTLNQILSMDRDHVTRIRNAGVATRAELAKLIKKYFRIDRTDLLE